MTPITKEREWLPIGAITVLAATARIAALGQPMRFDEAVSWAYYVGRSWRVIVTTYSYPNNQVLYSLLAKLFGQPFRYEPWALRAPALIAGIAIIPLTWSLAKRLTDDRTALLAAALCAGSSELTLFSTNARGYTLIVAFFLGMLIVADRLITQPSTRDWLMLAVLGVAGVYTMPVMLYPIGVTMLWVLLAAPRIQPAARRESFMFQLGVVIFLMALLTLLLYLPIVRHEGVGPLVQGRFVTNSTRQRFTVELVPLLRNVLVEWTKPLPAIASVVLAALAVIGTSRRGERTRPSLALACIAWCGALVLVVPRVPFVRGWIFLLPLFYIAVAAGVWRCADAIAKKRVGASTWPAVGTAMVLVLLLVGRDSVENMEDTGLFASAPEMTAFIAGQIKPGDAVIAPMPANGPLLYYFARAGLDTASLSRSLENASRAFVVLDEAHGRTVPWARANGVIDDAAFEPPRLVARFPDTQLWLTERR